MERREKIKGRREKGEPEEQAKRKGTNKRKDAGGGDKGPREGARGPEAHTNSYNALIPDDLASSQKLAVE